VSTDREVEAQWATFFDWLVGLDEDEQREYLTQLEAEHPERLHELAMAPGSPLVPDESGWVSRTITSGSRLHDRMFTACATRRRVAATCAHSIMKIGLFLREA
jgi:hypothetical protein